jgi:hypothetical protein
MSWKMEAKTNGDFATERLSIRDTRGSGERGTRVDVFAGSHALRPGRQKPRKTRSTIGSIKRRGATKESRLPVLRLIRTFIDAWRLAGEVRRCRRAGL